MDPDTAAPVESAEPTVTPESTPAVETPAAPDPYETEIGLLDVEPPTVSAQAAEVEDETPAQSVQVQAQPSDLTNGEKQILSRAGLPDKFTEGWDRTRLDTFVQHLAKSQAEQDKLGAELGRLKAGLPAEPKVEKPAAAPAAKTPRGEKIATLKAWAKENISDEMGEFADLLQDIDAENAQLRSELDRGPLNHAAEELVQDLVLELGFARLEKDYPSISKAEVRKQVEGRFWLEWNTGAYSKPGVPIQLQVREALSSAARVTLMPNITESSAAASLVTKNKDRLASQPRIGPQGTRVRPKTVDDIYDEAFDETMKS